MTEPNLTGKIREGLIIDPHWELGVGQVILYGIKNTGRSLRWLYGTAFTQRRCRIQQQKLHQLRTAASHTNKQIHTYMLHHDMMWKTHTMEYDTTDY